MDTEKTELLAALATHRRFLTHTLQGLTDEQARTRSTVSELTLAGILKHLVRGEAQWVDFTQVGPSALGGDVDVSDFATGAFVDDRFTLDDADTVESLLERYAEVALRTEGIVAASDLDASQPLPKAPWFTPGETRSTRRVLLHLLAETSQHAGHADIIREAIDGQKTM